MCGPRLRSTCSGRGAVPYHWSPAHEGVQSGDGFSDKPTNWLFVSGTRVANGSIREVAARFSASESALRMGALAALAAGELSEGSRAAGEYDMLSMSRRLGTALEATGSAATLPIPGFASGFSIRQQHVRYGDACPARRFPGPAVRGRTARATHPTGEPPGYCPGRRTESGATTRESGHPRSRR